MDTRDQEQLAAVRAVLLDIGSETAVRGLNRPARAPTVIRSFVRCAAAILSLTVAGQFVLQSRIVQGSSMAPTLLDGQRVLVDRWAYAGSRHPQRGEVVVFKAWPRHLDPFDSRLAESQDFVKRVVGVPGETIAIHGGRVMVDGVELEDRRFGPTIGEVEPIALGPGEYFVLGDNRANSSDSRLFGRLDEVAIIGRAWARFWPPESVGLIHSREDRAVNAEGDQHGVSGAAVEAREATPARRPAGRRTAPRRAAPRPRSHDFTAGTRRSARVASAQRR